MKSDSIQRQQEHYHAIADHYVSSRMKSAAYQMFLGIWAERLMIPWVAYTSAETRKKQVVLDPMCGHANMAPYFLQHTDHLILNDLSPDMLSHIEPSIRDRCTVLPPGSATDLPLDDGMVDVVAVSGGLHHLRSCLSDALGEFWRVMRPGGLFLFGEPSNEFLPVRLLRNSLYRLSSHFDHTNERAFRFVELHDALSHAGFESVQIEPFGSVGYLLMTQVGIIPILRGSKNQSLFRWLQRFDRAIEKSALFRRSCFALMGFAIKPVTPTEQGIM